uniref:Disease resistance protein winged helix domain-containing protein n=1 Tax=Brassica oleracea var. oleracea TaxID=109376 RepID=A0A0D3DNM3_BRAOL
MWAYGTYDLEVKHLDPEKAWELFRQNVRGTTLDSDTKILELAKQICEKCKGLPLALKVIGETMACKNVKVKDEILKIIKLSYDDLKDERAKQCFQYCALFPEDDVMDKNMLVEYWIYEGIINGDRERAINHGNSIIGILLSACLLMPVETLEYVTMHDVLVLRQMALCVASNFGEEEEKAIVKTGAGLQQMPEVRNWNAVRRMSLGRNEIQNISGSPECPNLTTLLLKDNKLVNISGDFFLSMPKLVILDLSTNLPEEVSSLVSLRHLDLSETSLENLPAGLGKLKAYELLKASFETATANLRSIMIEECIISDIMEHTRYGCTSTSTICFQNLIFVNFLEGLKSIYWERLELPCLKKVLISECPKLKKLPFSKERAYYFDLHAHNEEWFERLEWEDEATED